MAWTSAHGAADFYEARLAAGRTALAAQKTTDAEEDFHIAAFGMLVKPKPLLESLALLAVTQSRLGRTKELDENVGRFLRLEQRFTAYDPKSVEPYRAEFEALLTKRVPRQTLASIPTLARVADGRLPLDPPLRPATNQQGNTTGVGATPAAGPTPPAGAAERPATSSEEASRTPSSSPPMLDPSPSERTNLPANTAASTSAPAGTHEDAKKLLSEGKVVPAVLLLNTLVAQEPSRRDLRLSLLQAAVRSLNWILGTAQVQQLQPFRDSEPVYMFYGAVALYETGNVAGARDLLERGLPRLSRTAYVEEYVQKIRGQS